MSTFAITFGQRYRHDEHPLFPDAHPDGVVLVEADSHDDAQGEAFRRLGDLWANVYRCDTPDERHEVMHHAPRGVLATWKAGDPAFVPEQSAS